MKILHPIALFCILLTTAVAHPIPDIPIIGNFYSDGNASIVVEIDPRSFAEDPESIPFITEKTFKDLTDSNKSELLLKAEEMIKDAFDLRFGEASWFLPKFDLNFTEKDGGDVSEENIVVIEGRHNTFLDANVSFYQIRAKEDAPYDLIFTNRINGKPQRRVNVLFPEEESFKFDLSFIDGKSLTKSKTEDSNSSALVEKALEQRWEDTTSTFYSFLRKGFVHVLPEGLDHILFVIGLFLFSRKTKWLLLQVTTFTIAHTITIALASLNFISINPSIVEPLIALSIVLLAIENIVLRQKLSKNAFAFSFRLVTVFIFGLIHGLGFAGVSSLNSESPSFVAELIGFTFGVDLGQIAVILIFIALLKALSVIEKVQTMRFLSPVCFNLFLIWAISILFFEGTLKCNVSLIIWYAGLVTGCLSVQFESILTKTFGAGSLIKESNNYQSFFVIPGSALIGLIGFYWTIERVFF